jgi:oligopeptide/dipeptide ABC transporter ATP-binding protein
MSPRTGPGEVLLHIEDLRLVFDTEDGPVSALDGIGFDVRRNEILAVVGESGCGKSVTALSVLRLVPTPPGRYLSGRILFEGMDTLSLPRQDLQRIRGNKISMIFQEPMTSLNPVLKIGDQIEEAVRLHQNVNRRQARVRTLEMLRKVGIPSPEARMSEYPHQFSGGMRQRAMIAMAMACNPTLLIADEPTTALDVTIAAQIIDLMEHLCDEFGTAIMLITHDLGVVAECADRVVVMYLGEVVELASTAELFANPGHPYTKGLLSSLPKIDSDIQTLKAIEGNVPDPGHIPAGCRFHDRCPFVFEKCRDRAPPMLAASVGHPVRCWLWENQ